MCGIFGLVAAQGSPMRDLTRSKASLDRLYQLSETRGKEAAGLALANEHSLYVAKDAVTASRFIQSSAYQRVLAQGVNGVASNGAPTAVAVIGHSRLVTDGDRDSNQNNQPVLTSGVLGVHNGIIVNHRELSERHGIERRFDVDSEIIFAMIRKFMDEKASTAAATARSFGELDGAASVAAVFDDRDQMVVATNNGSLYYVVSGDGLALLFASERYILSQLIRADDLSDLFSQTQIEHIQPGAGLVADLTSFAISPFRFDDESRSATSSRPVKRAFVDHSSTRARPRSQDPERSADTVKRAEELFPYDPPALKRCTRCILPETMPFIEFDEQGVCSYCDAYQALEIHGVPALERLIAPNRRTDGRPDCIVGISGGRDSTYGLHYIKTELNMNPVAYTYDWGMVTDLARRNTSRICGKLGIEHIIVSADISKKRDYIRKNVSAWLKQPALGTVPLFTAGDKAYFHHLQKVGAQLEVDVRFLCENLLERTDFKSGFADVPPKFMGGDNVYALSIASKLRMLRYYGREFLTNPSYLNSSLVDSALGFRFYYTGARDYHNLFRYVRWEESEVERVILNEYDFELSSDTTTTWRIGDGTAAFYNYIYLTMAGFTEHDTFRSNQVREGVISRDVALKLAREHGKPRFESFNWYIEAIQLGRSLVDVLRVINAAPKLYR